MKYKDFVERYQQFPVITTKSIALYNQQDKKYLARQMTDRCTKGWLIQLQKGYYVLPSPTMSHSLFVLANYIYAPSYVSCESALSYRGMIPEAVYTTISMTTKNTRSIQTPLGSYMYHHCAVSQYGGHIYRDGCMIATPSKALADYCWLHQSIIVDGCVASLRLSFVDTFDTALFVSYIYTYRSHRFHQSIQNYVLPFCPHL